MQQYLTSDFLLLKAFPMLVKVKRDIEYTPEIIDYFIEHNADLIDEQGDYFINSIPRDQFSKEQLNKLFYKIIKSEGTLYNVLPLNHACFDNFGLAMMNYRATGQYIFPSKLTSKEWKKIVNMTIRKLRSSKSAKLQNNHSIELAMLIAIKFNKNAEMLTEQLARNYVRLAFTSHSVCTSKDDCKEYISNTIFNLIELYPTLYKDLVEFSYRPFVLDIIHNYLIPDYGLTNVVDNIIKSSDLNEDKFKCVCQYKEWACDGQKLLYILSEKYKCLTTTVYIKPITVYHDGAIKYLWSRLFNGDQK